MNPFPGGHEIYYCGRPFRGHEMYNFVSPYPTNGTW